MTLDAVGGVEDTVVDLGFHVRQSRSPTRLECFFGLLGNPNHGYSVPVRLATAKGRDIDVLRGGVGEQRPHRTSALAFEMVIGV